MIEIQKEGDQIIQTFCKIGSPQKLGPLIFNLQKFQDCQKTSPDSWRNDWNLVNDEEFGSIEILRLKYRRGDQIILTFCKIRSSQKLHLPIFNLQKLQDSEKSSSDSCRNDSNLMNDEEYGSIELPTLKYRKGDKIILTFSKIDCP